MGEEQPFCWEDCMAASTNAPRLLHRRHEPFLKRRKTGRIRAISRRRRCSLVLQRWLKTAWCCRRLEVLTEIEGSVRGKFPLQPRDGAGQAAHPQHPAGLVILLGQDARVFIHLANQP